MALTVSPAIRIVSVIGLLLALGAGGAMRFMGGAGSTSSVAPSQSAAVIRAKSVAARASARAKHPTAATGTHKTATAKPAAAAKATAAPKATPVASHAKPAAKPAKPATTAAPALSSVLPLPLAQTLAASPTVVAVLYNPQSEVDGIAVAEARAGAALAGVGFVALSVLSQRDVGKLTEQLGLLPDPAVLVFRRPAHLAARLDGFSDKETVAQAAQNAAHGA